MSDHPTGDATPPPYPAPSGPSGTKPPEGPPAAPYSTYPPYPPYPPYPGAPSMPLAPNPNLPPGAFGAGAPPSTPYPAPPPGYGGPPTQPGAAPYPGYPGYPSYPTYPGYPPAGYPPAGYPPAPGAPTTVPLYGQGGALYGMESGPAGAFATAPAATKPRSRWNPLTWLKGPLPVLMTIVFILIALLAVAGGALVGVQAGRGEWASGAKPAGIVALALAGVALILMGLRIGFGRRAASFFAVGLASIVVLGALGGSGLVLLPTPLHRAQAQSFENAHQWNDALAQYKLAGEKAPGSHDLARVYDEWGDELLGKQDYFDAAQKYELVISTYPNATAEVQRAQQGDAHALYAYGAQLLGQKQYEQAILEFAIVTTNYPTSAYAAQAHAGAATAYYGLGQQALQGGDCSGAVTDYQTLVKQFSDSPEGAKAKAALAAPVKVSGQITNLPGIQYGYVALSSHVTGAIATQPTNYDASNLSQDYKTQANSSGYFTFPAVAQGQYDLAVFLSDGSIEYWYYKSPYTPYTVTVGPLCAVNVGAYNYQP